MENEEFKKDLSIDICNLDDECLTHSSRYAYYAEAQAKAKANVSKAKDNLELVESKSSLKIRKKFAEENQKVTESIISCVLTMDSDVINAKNELRNAEEAFSRLSVAVNTMDVRKSELDNLVKLYCAGYFSMITEKMLKKG